MGLILVALWSLFVLKFMPTIVTLVVCFVGWGLVWGFMLVALRRNDAWGSVVAAGIPLVTAIKLATTTLVIYLGYLLLQ
jgi:hypothetical protein